MVHRLKSISKQATLWTIIIVSLWFSFMSGAAKVQALSTECTEAWLRDIGATTITCNDTLQCGTDGSAPVAPLVGSADVFVIGDSLTYGMVKLGGLLDKMSAAGFKVNTAYESPDSKTTTGTSVEAVGGYAIQQMQRNIDKHSQDFVRANAVMIALGTNPDYDFPKQSKAFVESIRAYNSGLKIYWVNTWFDNDLPSTDHLEEYTVINERIAASATANNFTVIDMAGAVNSGQAPKPGGDGIHYGGDGYQARSEWLTGALRGKVAAGNETSFETSSLTQDQKIGQTFVVGFNADQAEEMKTAAEKYKLGGVFILGKGAKNSVFNKPLFDEINTSVGIPLLVASDEEGGQIQRFADQIGAFPSAEELGKKTKDEVESTGKDMGLKLKALGVNTNLAPVLDVIDENEQSQAIAQLDRGFSKNKDEVTEKAGAFAKGLRAAGVNPVYKHFPGLGNTTTNTDNGATTSPPLSQLVNNDLIPFNLLVNQNNEMIMMNNAIVPELTETGNVASTSSAAVRLLREDYFFDGIITTDDLNAAAVSQAGMNLETAIKKSLLAGVTMPLFSWPGDAEMQRIIDTTRNASVDVTSNLARISRYKTETLNEAPQPDIPANCVCPIGSALSLSLDEDTRYRMAWGFFLQRGLSEEATAGLMGNLKAESGINPHNVENRANDRGIPDGPEIPIDAVTTNNVGDPPIKPLIGTVFRNNFGYGLAQWTSGGRQQGLIDLATAKSVSTGDMTLQLEWLWEELSKSYTGVLAVLQTPGVTVQQASDEVLLRFETPGAVILPPKGNSTPEKKQAALTARGKLGLDIFTTFTGSTPSYTPTASCGGANTQYPVLNPDLEDQTSIQCAEGTIDKGLDDGYRQGKLIRVRLCAVPSYTDDGASTGLTQVNAQMSARTRDMFNDAKAAGVYLSGAGFRTMEEGRRAFHERCGEDYPETKSWNPEDCTGAPIARPGYSNHQMGFAIDIACEGALIAQSYNSAKDNKCFQWLIQNASKYDYTEFPRDSDRYEAWHWSLGGG